tara:strand:- start:17 stop:247 length:231 start_codon:yes stop_codon:yes gene_type:complete
MFLAPQGGDWGYVVIKYGRIVTIGRKQPPSLFIGVQMRYSREQLSANLLSYKKSLSFRKTEISVDELIYEQKNSNC